MKKLIYLAITALLLASCGSKQYKVWDLAFDYPSIFNAKTADKGINDEHHLFFVDDGLSNSFDFLAVDIVKEDKDEVAGADEADLSAYLAESAWDMMDTVLDDKDLVLSKKPEFPEDVTVTFNNETGAYEATVKIQGKMFDDDFYAIASSTIYKGEYTLSMLAQAKTEAYLNQLVKIYKSVHDAE